MAGLTGASKIETESKALRVAQVSEVFDVKDFFLKNGCWTSSLKADARSSFYKFLNSWRYSFL